VSLSPNKSGCLHLIDALKAWGIRHCAGVNGGGVVHLLKHPPPYAFTGEAADELTFFSVNEYTAGFIPLGHRLRPDLGNLADIMQQAYRPGRPSMPVEVPIDAGQIVGPNPRIDNL